ncbi:hypothetical protein ABZP36_012339 [Zizania latifolia]
MAQQSKEPCKKEACDIQACLSKNMFDSRRVMQKMAIVVGEVEVMLMDGRGSKMMLASSVWSSELVQLVARSLFAISLA